MLVSPGHPNVEVYTRRAEGRWELARFRAGERALLEEIDAEIPVDAIYKNLPDEPAESATGRVEPERKP